MHKVIDSPWELGHCANALKAAGVETVIRYYNHSNSIRLPQKRIEKAEYDDILEAGLSLAVVFQQRGGAGGNIGDLDAEAGARDSDRALALAETNGQPENSAIYFAVDHDYYKAADLASIKAYFGAVSSALRGKYRVGVYGSGTVGWAVRDAGFVDFIWLAAATGWSGTRDMLNTDQWALYQVVPPLAFQGISYAADGRISASSAPIKKAPSRSAPRGGSRLRSKDIRNLPKSAPPAGSTCVGGRARASRWKGRCRSAHR
jgi:hypothetical protein